MKRTIKALSLGQINDGKIGFITVEEDNLEKKHWYNVFGEPEELKELVNNVLSKGSIIEFETDGYKATNITLVKKGEVKKDKFDKSDKFDNNLDTLLDSAHNKGLISITTELIKLDFENKFALFKATVKGKINDEIGEFTGYGDVSATNLTNANISPHFIRMAETRAIVRALRWYSNNSEVAEEEMEMEPEKEVIKEKTLKEKIVEIMNSKNNLTIKEISTALQVSEDNIKQVITLMLEEGECYEPTSGHYKLL